MGKISKKALEEIAEVLDRGCEFAGTQDTVHETYLESMEELGGCGDWDELSVTDLNDNEVVVQDLFEMFYDKAVEKIMNVLATQE